jgi:hypothetical protein
MNELYDSAELYGVIQTIRTGPKFFLDRFFRATPFYSTAEYIVFDEVLEGLPVMAPFVSPIVQAKPQKRHGQTAKIFSPAYVKPKHFVKPGDFVRRQPGQPLLQPADLGARMDQARLDLLAYQKRQIEARWEWMAAQAVVNGKVTVAGEDYPAVEVDFGRDTDHTVTLSSNYWSSTTTDIGAHLEAWSDMILQATGFPGTDLIMAPEIWSLFRKNEQVLKDADLRRAVSNVPNLQPMPAYEGVRYAGKWGEFDLWVYAGRFREQDGTTSRAIGAKQVVMTAAPSEEDGTGGLHGIRAFGAIQDKKAGLQPTDIFPKTWEEEDPSGEQIMSQSAPLMIPGRPNATIRAQVVA